MRNNRYIYIYIYVLAICVSGSLYTVELFFLLVTIRLFPSWWKSKRKNRTAGDGEYSAKTSKCFF